MRAGTIVADAFFPVLKWDSAPAPSRTCQHRAELYQEPNGLSAGLGLSVQLDSRCGGQLRPETRPAREHNHFRIESGAQQPARDGHPDRCGLSFGVGLSGLARTVRLCIRQAALSLARFSYRRYPPLVRLRHLLRVAGCLPDVPDVLPVGALHLAEP